MDNDNKLVNWFNCLSVLQFRDLIQQGVLPINRYQDALSEFNDIALQLNVEIGIESKFDKAPKSLTLGQMEELALLMKEFSLKYYAKIDSFDKLKKT